MQTSSNQPTFDYNQVAEDETEQNILDLKEKARVKTIGDVKRDHGWLNGLENLKDISEIKEVLDEKLTVDNHVFPEWFPFDRIISHDELVAAQEADPE